MKKGAKPLPSRVAGPAESPGFLLWKISNAWQRKLRQALQPFDLTHSQFVILATATWFSALETVTQTRLAELSGVDPMTTSQLVRKLQAASLLERHDHPGDPRANTVVVTTAGRKKAREAIVAVEDADAAFFLPVASNMPTLVELFRAIVDRIEQSRMKP
jgi:DNA-binding MarR family transcriptional regulator